MGDPAGTFVWHDLMTRDVKKAGAFYANLCRMSRWASGATR